LTAGMGLIAGNGHLLLWDLGDHMTTRTINPNSGVEQGFAFWRYIRCWHE